ALSLKRLRVDYREDGTNKFVLISPKDQMAFINAVHSGGHSN
ncbi:hypothetical protein D9B85_15335, partial [Corynebacterium diphtheriae]